MRSVNFENIVIGSDATPLVIPEIGINHEGSLEIAKDMVDAAHRAGARLIKHQTHIVKDEMCGVAKNIQPGNSSDSIYSIMDRCALSEEEEFELKQYVESKGMAFLSTPFSRAAADRLERFGVTAYKIGSGEMNNHPLIEYIAEFGKPMIVSTGMNDLKAVSKTVDILEKKGISYALMHTTNLYPTRSEQVRLGAMIELMREFPDVPIGLSDHTTNNNACIAAISNGARLVERHFTDYKARIGPDIICSMDENELKNLIEAAEQIPQMLGGRKESLKEEQVTIDFAFASVVTISHVKKGEKFTKENLWVKRPGIGEVSAEHYNEIIGKRAHNDISADNMLNWKDVEGIS